MITLTALQCLLMMSGKILIVKISINFKFIKRKGEGLPSPFLFMAVIFFMFNIGVAQFGSAEWLHPGTNIFTDKDTSSFMQLYNNSHIGLINFDDSLNITENRQ